MENSLSTYWTSSLNPSNIHFVQTADDFALVKAALQSASVIGLDAEWKPLASVRKARTPSTSPKVSILQIACRFEQRSFRCRHHKLTCQTCNSDDVHKATCQDSALLNFKAGSTTYGERSSSPLDQQQTRRQEEPQEDLHAAFSALRILPPDEIDNKIPQKEASRPDPQVSSQRNLLADHTLLQHLEAEGGSKSEGIVAGNEAIFVLDMLALPPVVFGETLKAALQSSRILKLGYGLKDDMRHLAASHPGTDAKGCFNKVEPYLDIGRVYRSVHLKLGGSGHSSASGSRRRDRALAFMHLGGLSGVVQSMLGLPLDKELQCSNWEQRPLSAGQLAYAATDSHCLLSVFDALCKEVHEVAVSAASSPTALPAGSLSEGGQTGERRLLHGEVKQGLALLLPIPSEACGDGQAQAQRLPRGTADSQPPSSILHRPLCATAVEVAMATAAAYVQDVHISARLSDDVAVAEARPDRMPSEEWELPPGEALAERLAPGGAHLVTAHSEVLLLSAAHTDAVSLVRNDIGTDVSTGRSPKAKSRGRRRRSGGGQQRLTAEEVKEGKELELKSLEWAGPAPWDPIRGGDCIPRFLCDIMVEGLARQLRCVGIDTASPPSSGSSHRQLVELAETEGRVLLTRDLRLLRQRLVPRHLAYYVRSLAKQDQLREIIGTFQLSISKGQLLSRCIRCNGEFKPEALTPKQALEAASWYPQQLPPCVTASVEEFWQCSSCCHLYWEGSQFDRAFRQFATVCQLDQLAE